jgi:hypothetical protein
MLHVFIGEILANMTQVSDVALGPLVSHPVKSGTIPGHVGPVKLLRSQG